MDNSVLIYHNTSNQMCCTDKQSLLPFTIITISCNLPPILLLTYRVDVVDSHFVITRSQNSFTRLFLSVILRMLLLMTLSFTDTPQFHLCTKQTALPHHTRHRLPRNYQPIRWRCLTRGYQCEGYLNAGGTRILSESLCPLGMVRTNHGTHNIPWEIYEYTVYLIR